MTTVSIDDIIEILAPKRRINEEHFKALLIRVPRRYDQISRMLTFKQWDEKALTRYDATGKEYWFSHWNIMMIRCRRRYDHEV